MATGQTSTSIRKRTLTTDKTVAIGFKKVVAAHKAAAGETSISLAALNLPSELSGAGFTNPSASTLSKIDLNLLRENLYIVSSARGPLMDYLSYTILGGNRIVFTDDFGSTLTDEIFTITIDPVATNGIQAVDGSVLNATGTLLAGAQDFIVGPFEVNKYPLTQIGAVLVYVDGELQMRNTGNATASSSADGNYQEVLASNGLGVIIRFNTIDAVNDRNVVVVSNGLLVEKPTASMKAEIQRLQGQIDLMVQTLAETTGVSQSVFQGAPNDVDLKAFGDRVIDLEGWEIILSTTTFSRKRVRKVLVDTTLGSFIVNLPVSPQLGDSILIMDRAGTFGINSLTIGRNGQNISGIADDFLLDAEDAWVELIYSGASRGWQVRG